MYLEVLLDGWKEAEKRVKAVGKKGKATKHHAAGGTDVVENLSMKELAEFLDVHPFAKIIIIINTHSLDETGAFVWGGTTPADFKTCYMHPVCVPTIHAIQDLTYSHIAIEGLPSTRDLPVSIQHPESPTPLSQMPDH